MTTDDWGDASTTDFRLPPATERIEPATAKAPPSPLEDTEHARRLRKTIEAEIVPRLIAARARGVLAAQRAESLHTAEPGSRRRIAPDDRLELQRLLLAHESTVASAYVEALINQGVLREEIYMDLLAPVARGLGTMWDEDTADFTQITVALGRLQVLLHELGRDSAQQLESETGARSVLLMPTPGEQHTFGLLVIGDFFRRRGWNVCNEFPKSAREVSELAANYHFDVIGFSLAADGKLAELTALIPALRRASQNASMRILVGGPLFLRRPELAVEIGADGTAADGSSAVITAERLIGERAELH